MCLKKKHPQDDVAPWDAASLLSRLLYLFVRPILRLGSQRPLQLSDLPPIPLRDRAWERVGRISAAWEAEIERTEGDKARSPSLLRALVQSHRADLWICGMLSALEVGAVLSQPNVLPPFITWLGDPDAPMSEGLVLAIAMSFLTLAQALLHHANFYATMRAGWNLRIGMVGMIHRKLLTISTTSLRGGGDSPAPDVAALVSSDCARFDNAMPFLHFAWLSGLEVLTAWASNPQTQQPTTQQQAPRPKSTPPYSKPPTPY
jgi:hypothetical protein